MDETQEQKGEEGNKAGDVKRLGCKSPVIFPSKMTVLY